MATCGSLWSFTISNFFIFFIVVNGNISCSNYQHCRFHPGHKLDCFGRKEISGGYTWRCEWQPGVSASNKTYTLIIEQDYCDTQNNINGQNQEIKIFQSKDMKALVVENPLSQNCTKAIFEGTPKNLFRCGPPVWASFSRHSGNLDVKVDWLRHEKKLFRGYKVRYKPLDEESWKNLSRLNKNDIRVERLNSNLVFMMQIKCAQNSKCSQCPWSDSYIIPPELKTPPILIYIEKVDHPLAKGSRLVSFTWKTVEIERPDGFFVDIQKASGELPRERFNTSEAEMTLHLSCSTYIVNISAFNNVSVSPALSQTIKSCEGITALGRLNVTVHSNTCFTVTWEAQLLNNFVCYSVEWNQKNQNKTAYLSFFEDTQNNRTFDLTEPLEPYKRYTLSLHTRVNRDTCNLKHINSTESTFGSVHFYFMEGFPISAPTNISVYNVTSRSMGLQWSPIPEEDLRGFLMGYIIYYKEWNNNRHARTAEKVLCVEAELTSYVIEDLKPGTGYQVEISGFTKAGVGVRSIRGIFETYKQVYMSDSVIISVFVATIVLLIVVFPILKRTKAILWPSIPNPENSNAIQKIEKSSEIELLESLQTLKVEEWHTNGLQFIEETDVHVSLPNLFGAGKKEDSALLATEEVQEDVPEDTVKDIILDHPADLELNGPSNPKTAFACGYTTLEMFQQTVTFQCSSTINEEVRDEMQDDVLEIKPVLDYVGQFCSSPTFDFSTRL